MSGSEGEGNRGLGLFGGALFFVLIVNYFKGAPSFFLPISPMQVNGAKVGCY